MKKLMLALTFLVLATTQIGCSKKSDGKKTRFDRYGGRSSDYRDNRYDDNRRYSGAGSWGVIYSGSNSMNSVLEDFMGVTDLGYVSGRENDDTGVRFRGEVLSRRGSIDILVWDEYTNNGEDPYFWTMDVVDSIEGELIVAEDSAGRVVFKGNSNSREFTGTVTFQNDDGTRGTLGRFAIDYCAIFDCR